ncbi:MAG: GIY-YIG nuclease family protein [Candidatus Hodarchaeota archaeon]
MPYWVYMLLVGDKSHGSNRRIYTGYTHRLMSRITQHSGLSLIKGSRLTRRQPIELVYVEKFSSRKLARQREWQLKHENPYNQKTSKLKLIEEFQTNYGQILEELNDKLWEHFEFLESIARIMKTTEKELINKLRDDT